MFKGIGDKIKGLGGDEIKKYMRGLNFPTNTQNVMSTFKSNNAPPEIMSALGKLPNTNFNSQQDLINAIKGKL